jgi:hypothetical protein
MATREELLANDAAMEWIAIGAYTAWAGETRWIHKHETRREQWFGDFSVEKEDFMEVKHRSQCDYPVSDSGIGSLKMEVPFKWEEAPEDKRLFHIDAFPEIGKVLVYEVEKGDIKTEAFGWKERCKTVDSAFPVAILDAHYSQENIRLWRERKGKKLW